MITPTELTKSQKLKLELTMSLRVFDCSLGKEGEIISNNKENGKKIYDKSLFDYPDYLEIKQEFISMICRNPYNWKIEWEGGLEMIKDYWFRYNTNSCSWKFDLIRQKHWMDGFSEEEKQKIKKCLNTHQENSQQLKKEILNDLSSWSTFFLIFNDKKKIYLRNGIADRGCAYGYKNGWSEKKLSREDYQEVRNAVIKNVIDKVKQNPHEWRIQNVCTFNGDRPDFKYMGGYQEWEEKLIHYSVPSQYEWEWEDDFEKHKRKVFKRGLFSNEEWAEIENVLKKQHRTLFKEDDKEIQKVKTEMEEMKTNKGINNSERQIELRKKEEELAELERDKANANNTTQKSKSNDFPTGWVVGGGIMLVLGLITILIIKKSKKNK